MEATEAGKQGGDDMSMEEILQSIRKIIAEDDTGKKPAEAKTNGQQPMAEAKAEPKKAEVPGSDVLELTEMLKEDGTVQSVAPVAKKEEPKPAAGGDVLSAIDTALKPGEPKPAAAAAPIAPAAPAAVPAGESLLSSEAAAAAAAALRKLQQPESSSPVATTPAPAFRSGETIEGLVGEMLRPMMKAWLDANLPPIVERIVEREVKKLTK